MIKNDRVTGMRFILCFVFLIYCDGLIRSSQMSKTSVQIIEISFIRKNPLHSETISNRPSSSLPASNQNGERNSVLRNDDHSVSEGNNVKVRRDLETLQQQDQNKQHKSRNVRHESPTDKNMFIDRLQQALDENKLRSFAKILKSLAMEGGNSDCLSQLVPLLEKVIIKDLDSTETSDFIWALGKLNLVVQNSVHKPILTNLMNRFCEHEEMSSREVTTSLVGFSKLRFRWNYLSEDNRADIILAVSRVASTLNDREVGNLLHSLSKLAVPWSAFPRPVQNDLLESFIRVSKLLVSQQGSMAVYSLGLMGLNLENVTPAVRDHIFVVALSVLEESKVHVHQTVTQQVSNVIYGLAKMGVKYRNLPPNVSKSIDDGILNAMGYMNEQEISNSVYSLGIMGARWPELSPDVRDMIRSTLVIRFNKMITQGVSNIMYGMGLMGIDWHSMGNDFTDAASSAFVSSFSVDRRRSVNMGGSAQAVANVIYSLGVSGATWEELPVKVRTALMDGLVEWGPELTSQELSNLVYGLGLMRANYDSLPPQAIEALDVHYDRMKLIMNEQEVCSTLHGFAKMSAKWDDISDSMRRSMLVSIASLLSVGSLCLACSVYSLGMLGATWDRLPNKIRESFQESANARRMQDQTISNVVYGLSLLKTSWATIEDEFREVLLDNLAQSDAFKGDVSQHISNTLWGLAKMDASWGLVPSANLEDALNRVADQLSPQETSNALYGLAVLDTPWNSLSIETHRTLHSALTRTILTMTNQETANVMYSLALMTYDAPYGRFPPPKSISDPQISGLSDAQMSMNYLWDIHRMVIENFKDIDKDVYSKENYDQYGMYYEMMRVAPGGNELVFDILGTIPRPTGIYM
jgi:hypothetical protein